MTSLHATGRVARMFLAVALFAIATHGCGCEDKDPGDGDGSVDGDGHVMPPPPPGCGNGTVASPEVCDDGNNADDDGCSYDCAEIDSHYLCPTAGAPCIRVVTCGNDRIEGDETCDDGNTVANDGCDAECHKQDGWTCTPVGVACVAERCGDGIRAGFEACDDGDTDSNDGCSSTCKLEPNYDCSTQGVPCTPATCGNGTREGLENCDDGNAEVGDGCDTLCHREPSCSGGVCQAMCGDGVRWAPEACDDGNTVGGDGCSADCSAVEPGFSCTEQPLPLPPSVTLPVTYRDFMANCNNSSTPVANNNNANARLAMGQTNAVAPYGHPDFDCYSGGTGAPGYGSVIHGMVADTLDGEGKPVRGTNTTQNNSAASFAQWYRTTPDVNLAIPRTLVLGQMGSSDAYQFTSGSFFPLTGAGWMTTDCNSTMAGVQGCENGRNGGNNFFFTSEVHFWFEYQGDGSEVLRFDGDDDVWVFIDGRLAVDVGGVHGSQTRTLDLDDYVDDCDGVTRTPTCNANLDLTVGSIYEGVVFQAERHVTESNYTLTLTGFTQAPSVCVDDCGDGQVSSREQCDLGDANNGNGDGSDYGGCTTSCTFEPFCGDGTVNGTETCDDGLNLGGSASSCSPGCMGMGATCGDGVTQFSNGEQCDDGNQVDTDDCSNTCIFQGE